MVRFHRWRAACIHLHTSLDPTAFSRAVEGAGTSKSEQFWQRPSGSLLLLHLMLRLLQKSPTRHRYGQLPNLTKMKRSMHSEWSWSRK
ncbi:hypothetical protein N7468_007354 [Penicillium chermesinum]|uniref:Uncharacterized protein n=1 Tax=Penicillium chermesinum TaxID=63820 RepID=A0A9W9TKQ0_9EURO|nr:uncharacterized protein N7468_007354 [Penicillium chermesinum]KAJ5226129.1 hypothetical protein N7468_007354 [Penicillium chermesinum]